MAMEMATSSGTLVSAFLAGMGGLDSAIMYTISLGITAYGFIQSIDFNKLNKPFWLGIEDSLDREVFQKLAVPLYKAITANVFNDIFPLAQAESASNKKTFLERYEGHKLTKLKEVDFTFLDESLDFQAAITGIISSRINHVEFKKLKKKCRYWVMGIAAAGFLSLVTLIGSNISETVFNQVKTSNIVFILYLFFLIVAVLFGVIYWIDKTKLDNMA